MEIKRYGVTARWADAVIFNSTVYLVEVASNPSAGLKAQSQEILDSIANTLQRVGSDKSQILTATIYLADIATIDDFNEIWDNWLLPGTSPSRACVEARLAHPEYKVEIQITAAVSAQS